jgi:hypothetical protein
LSYLQQVPQKTRTVLTDNLINKIIDMKLTNSCCALVILLVAGLSCRKNDFPFIQCKIVKMVTVLPAGSFVDKYEYDISYNSWGAPVKLITSFPGTGNENYEFFYDSKHRLTGMRTFFQFDQDYVVTRYLYGSGDVILGDSTFIVGSGLFRTARYQYDDKMRIVRVDYSTNYGGPFSREFEYDSRGNLIRPGVVYDNKVNFHRTHPLWMFVDLDYSMNNPLPSGTAYKVTYNKKGLVTSFTGSPGSEGPYLLNKYPNIVEYDCSPGKNDWKY